ncbi:MAG: hypothetical protein ACLFRD_07985 [Nitriliruptoraceae bacterium]
MADDDILRSPDTLLRHAAAADAETARGLLARVSTTRLLDLVVTQAELAVDEEAPRGAGIDAVGDLARTAIEIMELPQGADLDLEDDVLEPPTVTGWELITVEPAELLAATLGLPVRPWMLALVAFADTEPYPELDMPRLFDDLDEQPSLDAHLARQQTPSAAGLVDRRVVAAAADGRVVAARLSIRDPQEDADVLTATATRDPDELGPDAPLARALLASLASAARGEPDVVR